MIPHLLQGHALRIPLPDESVQCIVTSPPYWGLRDYGLLPLVWGGDNGCQHRWGDEIIQEGETWGHGPIRVGDNANPRSEGQHIKVRSASNFCQFCGAWRGCLGLEPTIDLYVQHMVEIGRELRRVLRGDGTMFINISDTRTPTREWAGIPHRLVFALQADGWRYEDEVIWSKKNPMPGSQTNRFTRSHEFVFMFNKSRQAFFDSDAVREEAEPQMVKMPDGWETGAGAHGSIHKDGRQKGKLANAVVSGRNRRTVWHIATAPYAGAHFATYPPALVEPCIKAGTSERGCCPECGKGWERIVNKPSPPVAVFTETRQGEPGEQRGFTRDGKAHGSGQKLQNWYDANPQTTLGWRPACGCYGRPEQGPVACGKCGGIGKDKCLPADLGKQGDLGKATYTGFNARYFGKEVETDDPCPACEGTGQVEVDIWPDDVDDWPTVPATVFDPFVGSGTTLLVARALGRHGVGLDLSHSYLVNQARTRLELDKWDAWEKGVAETGESALDDLPLFRHHLTNPATWHILIL